MRHRSGRHALLVALVGTVVGCGQTAGGSRSSDGATAEASTTLGASGSTGAGPGVAATDPAGSPAGPGVLVVYLAGLPDSRVEELRVRIVGVTVHLVGGGWTPLDGVALPVDLDVVTSGPPASPVELGELTLPPGTITQLRLLVAAGSGGAPSPNDVVVAPGATVLPLVVPSGSESGVKLLGPWTITPCARTSLVLELDGPRSLWLHPTRKETEWILRPVVRLRSAFTTPGACPETNGSAPLPPAPAGAGAGCSDGSGCLSGVCTSGGCTSGTCAPSPAGGACAVAADCATGSCVQGTCGSAGTGGVSSSCSSAGECASNECTNGVCQPGGQGAPCVTAADCLAGLSCVWSPALGTASCLPVAP